MDSGIPRVLATNPMNTVTKSDVVLINPKVYIRQTNFLKKGINNASQDSRHLKKGGEAISGLGRITYKLHYKC